jgi:CheY-like chemotaxis protein
MSSREAIEDFRAGDFDLVLLGHSVPMEDKEKLTSLIRASGSRTPVVCVAKSPGDCNPFADATLNGDEGALLKGMRAALAKAAKAREASTRLGGQAAQCASTQRRDGRQAAPLHANGPALDSEELERPPGSVSILGARPLVSASSELENALAVAS